MPTAGAALALCTLQNIRKMSNLHKNDTNSLEETCIQLSALALARLRSQRLAGRLAARDPAPGHAFHLWVFNIKATNSRGSAGRPARLLPPAGCPPHRCPTARARRVQGRGWQFPTAAGQGFGPAPARARWGRGHTAAAPPGGRGIGGRWGHR